MCQELAKIANRKNIWLCFPLVIYGTHRALKGREGKNVFSNLKPTGRINIRCYRISSFYNRWRQCPAGGRLCKASGEWEAVHGSYSEGHIVEVGMENPGETMHGKSSQEAHWRQPSSRARHYFHDSHYFDNNFRMQSIIFEVERSVRKLFHNLRQWCWEFGWSQRPQWHREGSILNKYLQYKILYWCYEQLRLADVVKHGPLSRWKAVANMRRVRKQRPGRGQKILTLGLLVSLALFTAESLDFVEHRGALSSFQLSTSGFCVERIWGVGFKCLVWPAKEEKGWEACQVNTVTSLGAVSDLLIINMKLWPEEALDGGCFPDQNFIMHTSWKKWSEVLAICFARS